MDSLGPSRDVYLCPLQATSCSSQIEPIRGSHHTSHQACSEAACSPGTRAFQPKGRRQPPRSTPSSWQLHRRWRRCLPCRCRRCICNGTLRRQVRKRWPLPSHGVHWQRTQHAVYAQRRRHLLAPQPPGLCDIPAFHAGSGLLSCCTEVGLLEFKQVGSGYASGIDFHISTTWMNDRDKC